LIHIKEKLSINSDTLRYLYEIKEIGEQMNGWEILIVVAVVYYF